MVNSTILTPNSRKVRRKNELGKERSPGGTNDSTTEFCWTTPTSSDSKTESGPTNFSLRWKNWNWSNFHSFTLVCLGVVLALSYFYYVTTMFETVTRFSHLSNLERELSLPTDVAFRYSFYKKIADADSYVDGLRSVIYDRNTDWPRSTNSFKKHSLTVEAVLGAGFHLLKKFQEWTNLKLSNCWLSRHSESGTGGNGDEAFSCIGLGDTLHFYLYAFWALESAVVALLFYFGRKFSNSVVGGITTALLFMVTHPQRSNYEWIFPREEKAGWAAALIQIFILSHFILGRRFPSWTGCVKIAMSTAILFLCWRTEAQWILLSQIIIISLLHFASFITRYSASLIIFGQITGWQYASLVSFDASFIHWSFFLYVLMAAIITIFLVEPILDWVMGDKIEKWMLLRATILLISFQMILISVRCDFGRVVGLKEDNRFPFSIGVMNSVELEHWETKIKPPSAGEQNPVGYFPSASAELLHDQIARYRRARVEKENKEASLDYVSVSSSAENSVEVSPRPNPFFQSYSKYAHLYSDEIDPQYKYKYSAQVDTNIRISSSKTDETVSYKDAIRGKRSHFHPEVSILENSEEDIRNDILDSAEMEIETFEDEDEQQGKRNEDEKSPLQREPDVLNNQFPRFISSCFGSPLKFSLQVFVSKYTLLLLAGFYVIICGVILPAVICYHNDKREREKMKKSMNEYKRNGNGFSGVFDISVYYNCYYRFANAHKSGTFAKTLGFTVADDRDIILQYYWSPVILYNALQLGVFMIFCCVLDKHWELLFVTQLSLLLSLLVDYKRVNTVFGKLSCGYGLGTNVHWFAVFGIVSIIFAASRLDFDRMYQNSRGRFETSNPRITDLVEAVTWIRMNAGSNSSFAGVESLMTIVYLSAQRPCVNHHHSAHLLTPETVGSGSGEKIALPLQFPLPNVLGSGRSATKKSEMEENEKKLSLDGVFDTNKKSYSDIKGKHFRENKYNSDSLKRIEVRTSTSNSQSQWPLLNVDLDFDKREKESLLKVYSMFSRRKSISEFHDGLLSLNVSYLFLSRELCSPPSYSASSMFFDNDSSKTEKSRKSFSPYGKWSWEDPRVDKDYAHWQQIGKDCDFISFWDSLQKLDHKERKQKEETVSTINTEILCFKLMDKRNIKPFIRVFENGFYTLLATSSS